MVTKINWKVDSGLQSFPLFAITEVAISAIIATGISCGVLILIG
jgi:hypothetical protein